MHHAVVLLVVASIAWPSELRPQAPDRPLRIEVTPLFTLGMAAGEAWQQFADARAVAFDAQGRLLILDGGNRRILQVGVEGRLVRSIGRAGRGPGELSRPMGLAVSAGGDIVVFDAGPSAFTVFDSSGAYRRTIRPPFGRGYPGRRLRADPRGGVVSAAGDGQMVVPLGEQEPARFHLNRYLLDRGAEPQPITTAWRASDAGPARPQQVQGSSAVSVSARPAFIPELHFDVLADGAVAVADSTTYRVMVHRPGNESPVVFSRAIAPRATTRADRRAEAERLFAQMSFRRSGGLPLSPARSADELFARMSFWPERSVIRGLRAGPDRTLWVARESDGGVAVIDVWHLDGRYLGTARSPDLQVPDAVSHDGRVAWIREGADGEVVVHVARVARR